MKHFNFSKTLSVQPAAADSNDAKRPGGPVQATLTPLMTPSLGGGSKGSSELKEDWYKIQSGLNKFQSELKAPGSTDLLFSKSRRSAGKRMQRGKGRRTAPSLPPPISTTPTFDHTFRFSATGTGSLAVTCEQLALAFGSVCTVTNSRVVSIISSFRIKKVTIWPSPSAGPDDADVYWYSPVSTMSKDVAKSRELPTGVTVTGPMVSRPPRGSLCGAWIQTNTALSTPLFGFACGGGSVIDIHAVCTVANNLGASSALDASIATAVLGNVYYLALDGHTNNYPAVGITTTH